VIEQEGHLRTRGKCRKHELQASVFFILECSKMSGLFYQCNTRLRLLELSAL